MIFENSKNYDRLKFFTTRVLPPLIFFYGILGTTLKIPYTTETLTIATGLETALCKFLRISKKKFNELNAEFENEDVDDYEVIEEE